MRTIVIGDVHGCLDELLALLQRCGRSDEDRVVLVGDLVAKGPDSAGVIQWARESGVDAVLGNHDAHVLRGLHGEDVKGEHRKIAEHLSAANAAWLEARPLWLPLDLGGDWPDRETRWAVLHGGGVPGVPLPEQKREHLLNLRSITDDGQPSKRIEGRPWASVWPGPEHIVFGHDAVRGLQQHPHATGLDTGCVYGRELTALVLPERKLVHEPARRAYAEISAKKK